MSKTIRRPISCLVLLVACSSPQATTPAGQLLDAFDNTSKWKVAASDGVTASLEATVDGADGRAMRLNFDFRGNAGYATVRRQLPLELPDNYEISLQVRADFPGNDFELKLIDASGENVWWYHRRNVKFGKEWERLAVKKRHIEFAWGPTDDKTLSRVAAIEFAVTAGERGGRGSFSFDQLAIRALPIPPKTPPALVAAASSSDKSSAAAAQLATDGQLDTAWVSDPRAGAKQHITFNLGYAREFSAIVFHWRDGQHASSYELEASPDGKNWKTMRRVAGGNGGRDPLWLPESEASFLRLVLHQGPADRYALSEIEIQGIATANTITDFVVASAKTAKRGHYPRGFVGEQVYWTLVGAQRGGDSGLLSEDGALEIGRGGFSIEPFVIQTGDVVATWADVQTTHSLMDGYLPIPTVTWRHPKWKLRVTAFAEGDVDRVQLAARYEIENSTRERQSVRLLLAVRPFQVNPPSQFLNLSGGVSAIDELRWDGTSLTVNKGSRITTSPAPERVELHSFDGGAFPQRAAAPAFRALEDETGLASATLAFQLDLAPGEKSAVTVSVPLVGASTPPAQSAKATQFADRLEQVATDWRRLLNRVAIHVPSTSQVLVDTLRTTLAHMFMSSDGPALRPGTRSYARSWIRDGAMMSEGLLRLGHGDIAADYLRWYAPHQFANGKVPCCVDSRGAGSVPEHDSAGQLIFLAAEVFRFGRDRTLLATVWPHVKAAVAYMEKLRQSERTARNREPARRAYFGLLPPSISHEGYSDRPAYSYWDDFWALRGYQDAVAIAEELGHTADARRIAAHRDEFRRELHASLLASTAAHGIDYLPGAADRGDFDATSTTIALSPGNEQHRLPPALLTRTFERYWQEFSRRRDGSTPWDQYTPYELRNVSSFVRLGWRARAEQLLGFFMSSRRPAAWNQWAEVVGREVRQVRFIGDMPHAWIASDYIRAVLDLFCFERPVDDMLVLAAGIPTAWFADGGVAIRNLRTQHGTLTFSMRKQGRRITVAASGSAKPPGGFAVPWPWSQRPNGGPLSGTAATWSDGELRFSKLPARIEITLEPSDQTK